MNKSEIEQKKREHKENCRKKFEAAPKCVQDEYHRCNKKIKKFLGAWLKKKKSLQGFERALYIPPSGQLTETHVVELHDLLRLDGWDVVLATLPEWCSKKGPRPIGLLFRYRGGPSKT